MRPAALLAVLALTLSLSSCGGAGNSSGVQLYFCADPAKGTPHGPAILSQPYQGPEGPGVEAVGGDLIIAHGDSLFLNQDKIPILRVIRFWGLVKKKVSGSVSGDG